MPSREKSRRLAVHRVLGVFAAEAAKRRDRQIVLVLALCRQLFLDVCFDRQAVAVVAGHIRRVKTHHRTRFDDKILENLIERRADMNVGIGIRRAVVEDEFVAAFACLDDLLIQPHFRPFLQTRGLALAEIRLLRKIGPGQVNCFL